MTLAVKVALNPNTTNQSSKQFEDCNFNEAQIAHYFSLIGKKTRSEKIGKMLVTVLKGVNWLEVLMMLTHSLIHHFETAPNAKKLQSTTEMWLLKDSKIQIT